MTDLSWQDRRRENARLQQERMLEREEKARLEAAGLLRDFAAVAKRQLPAQKLVAFSPANGRTARTKLFGWYLKADRSVAVDVDGAFYILTRPLSLKDCLFGVEVTPSAEQMVLGKGGRDGESIDLPDALKRLLPNWRAID